MKIKGKSVFLLPLRHQQAGLVQKLSLYRTLQPPLKKLPLYRGLVYDGQVPYRLLRPPAFSPLDPLLLFWVLPPFVVLPFGGISPSHGHLFQLVLLERVSMLRNFTFRKNTVRIRSCYTGNGFSNMNILSSGRLGCPGDRTSNGHLYG